MISRKSARLPRRRRSSHLARDLRVFLCALFALFRFDSPAAEAASAARAPDFELPRYEGGTFRLSEESSPCCLLLFVRSGGHFVTEAMDAIDTVVGSAPEYQDSAVLACVSEEADERSLWERFQSRKALNWVLLKDRTGSVHRQYQIIAVPTVALVDGHGVLHKRFPSYSMMFASELRSELRSCLGLPPLAEATTATRRAVRYAAMADRMADRGVWRIALESYESALKIAPDLHRARWGAAVCLLEMKRAKEAQIHLALLRKADALTTSVEIGLAWVDAVKGDATQAQNRLSRVGSGAAAYPEYHEAWAAVYESQGEKEKADAARKEAVALRHAGRKGSRSGAQPPKPPKK